MAAPKQTLETVVISSGKRPDSLKTAGEVSLGWSKWCHYGDPWLLSGPHNSPATGSHQLPIQERLVTVGGCLTVEASKNTQRTTSPQQQTKKLTRFRGSMSHLGTSMLSVRNRCQIHFQCDKHNKREKKQYSIYVYFFIPPDGSFLFFYGVWSIHVFPQDVFPRPATRVAASSAHLPPLPVATGARRSSASWDHKEDVGPQPGSTYQALVALTPVK